MTEGGRVRAKTLKIPNGELLMTPRLPLHHPLRVRHHDSKLWMREQARAAHGRSRRMRCPCTQCQGFKSLSLDTVYLHLRQHERHPRWRVWNVAEEDDSSDEEWRADFLNSNIARRREYNEQDMAEPGDGLRGEHPNIGEQDGEPESTEDGGMDVPRMVQEIFQDLDAFYDSVQSDEDNLPQADGGEGPPEPDFDIGQGAEHRGWMFGSPEQITEACNPIYEGSKCSKLAFVVLLLNMCGNHNVPNVFVTELLTFLRNTVLPDGNSVPKNMYEARKLMSNLGLNYVSIHACPDGHVLFRKENADR